MNVCFKLRCFLFYFFYKLYIIEGKSFVVVSCLSEDGVKVINYINMLMVMRCYVLKYMIKNEN